MWCEAAARSKKGISELGTAEAGYESQLSKKRFDWMGWWAHLLSFPMYYDFVRERKVTS